MTGSKRFRDFPETVKVSCDECGRQHQWALQELKDEGVGKDVAAPDLIHGLARLLKCERHKLSEQERKSKPCMLKYVDLWG